MQRIVGLRVAIGCFGQQAQALQPATGAAAGQPVRACSVLTKVTSGRVLTIQMDVPTGRTTASIQPNVIALAKALLPKLRQPGLLGNAADPRQTWPCAAPVNVALYDRSARRHGVSVPQGQIPVNRSQLRSTDVAADSSRRRFHAQQIVRHIIHGRVEPVPFDAIRRKTQE